MKKYLVKVQARFEYEVTVEATSEANALKQANQVINHDPSFTADWDFVEVMPQRVWDVFAIKSLAKLPSGKV